MIKVLNLSVRYGRRQVLKEINFQVEAGSWVCLIGPNGAGKSTLLRALLGLLPYSGSIKYSEREIAAGRTGEIAFVPQRPEIPSGMRVRDYIYLGRAPRDGWGVRNQSSDALVSKIMAESQLLGLANQYINQLSGGELQRALIARALAQEPKVMLLDEPTSALDLHHQIATLSLVEAAQKRGVTVVTTMHDITLGAMFSSKFILLNDGEIAAEGSANDVVHSPKFKAVFDHKLSVLSLDGHQPVVIAKRDLGEPK